MRLNVRCSSSPNTIFGTLEIPGYVPDRPTSFPVFTFKPLTLTELFEADITDSNTDRAIEMIETRYIDRLGQRELAIYSDDRPIEFWRQLPDFREGEKIEGSI